jgi:hypothetical protein
MGFPDKVHPPFSRIAVHAKALGDFSLDIGVALSHNLSVASNNNHHQTRAHATEKVFFPNFINFNIFFMKGGQV